MQQCKYLISVILLLALPFICFGQYKNVDLNRLKRCSVKTLNFEQGLMNNETGSVITDRWGFTWVSTKTGIQRFNGYVLEHVNPVVEKDTILINYPVIFFPLKNGNFWISYQQGILEYNPTSNHFIRTLEVPAIQKGLLPVLPVLQNEKGIWCMYAKKGIVIYNNGQALRQQVSQTETIFIDSILQSASYLSTRAIASNGTDVFLSDTKRVLHINTATKTVNYLQTDFGLIHGIECTSTTFYATAARGFFLIDIKSEKVNSNVPYATFNHETLFLAQVYLVSGNQLLVSVNRHLYEFDTAGIYQKEFTLLNGDPVLPTGHIHFLYADRFKRIWMMTNDDIKIIQNVEIPFALYISPNAKSNFAKCIYYDEQKQLLLVGYFNGGVQLYDTSGNHLWEKPIIFDGAKDVMNIEKLTADDYLLLTYFSGWFILNLPSKRITTFPMSRVLENIIHTNSVSWTNTKQRINDSVVFIATRNNVYDCRFRNTELKSADPLLPDLTNAKDMYNCFIYTSDKTLWTGTSSGMLYVKDKTGNLKKIVTPGNYGIRCAAEDANHVVWVGADKGLFVYNSTGELLKTITLESGILNDCIYGLLPVDNQSAVFASNNFGLAYVSADGKIKNYTKEVGLQGNEFNNGAARKTLSGKFYFGGVNGVTAFYPSALSAIKDTPVLNITRLVVNDSVYTSQGVARNVDSIYLKYDQNHIQLDIAANGLLNTEEYIYTYRLKGLDEPWQTTRQPTAIRYTLDPGSYTLEINCSPYLSTNTIFSKQILIVIHPPWWRTWWFRTLAALFIAFLIALIVWQYNRRSYLKKIRALQVQQEVQQERERISRDLHDNLGAYVAAIAANVNRVQEANDADDKEASLALNELQANSQSIIAQLHDTIWALNKKEIALTAISDKFKIFLRNIGPTYPGIDISVKEAIETDIVLSPVNALHLFRIMQEAVNNAVRHSSCRNITVSIESTANWKVSIIDDGSGMDVLTKSSAGNGLKNIRQRAKEAGWVVEWSENAGTCVLVKPD